MSQKSGGEAGPPPSAALASGRTRFTSLDVSSQSEAGKSFLMGFAQSCLLWCVYVMLGCLFSFLARSYLDSFVLVLLCFSFISFSILV